MDDHELLRYARQIFMPEIDIKGQTNIINSHVAIFGLGGLGSLVSRLVAGAGVKNLMLIDNDVIEMTNIPRQVLYDETDIGKYKVDVLEEKLLLVDGSLKIKKFNEDITNVSKDEFLSVDVLVDCTDNFNARKYINEVSLEQKIPYVYGAANRFEGEITVFNPREESSPCLLCWQKSQPIDNSCQHTGILAPVVNVIASMQATECLKLVGKFGHSSFGKVNFYDGFFNEWQCNVIIKKGGCCCSKVL